MRYRLKCPANRYVFKSRLNCSESTAGSLRQSGNVYATVGPVCHFTLIFTMSIISELLNVLYKGICLFSSNCTILVFCIECCGNFCWITLKHLSLGYKKLKLSKPLDNVALWLYIVKEMLQNSGTGIFIVYMCSTLSSI